MIQKNDEDHLYELIGATNKANPKKSDIESLRTLLTKPELLHSVGTFFEQNIAMIVKGPIWMASSREVVQAYISDMQKEFGYSHASQLEKLLIDAVLLTWLRWQEAEMSYTQLNQQGMTLTKSVFWEKRLTATHNRFLRASDILARVRRLTGLLLQVNIANEGGQQVNVAGNVVKE